MVLVEAEGDLPAEAVEEEHGLAPGRVHLGPVHRDGGKAPQPTTE